MNELIFELAQQAEEYATTRHAVSNIALSVNSEKFVKKLAQLIARECAQLAMTQHCSTSPADYGDMEPYQKGCDDTASVISGLIRRTFEVQE